MEEKRFVIRPRLERKLLEDLVALHSKVGKDTDTKINRIANAVLLIAGIVLLACSAELFWIDGISGTAVLSLALGAFAVVWFAFRGRIAARRMQRNSEKYAQDQVITLDDAGIRAESKAAQTAYQYDAVEAIYRWRGAYVLYVDKIHIIPLPTADFIEGDPAEFGEYLSEKTGLPVQTPSDKKKEHQQ